MSKRMLLSICGIAVIVLLIASLSGIAEVVEKLPSQFNEAPILRTRVAAGELPPVEERVSEEPKVYKPVHEIGKYGGTWHNFMLGPADRWSPHNKALQARLAEPPLDPSVFIKKGLIKGLEPHVAKSWKFNEDYTELTLYLRKGMKWSDGEPFTTEDIRFAWEDIWLNEEYTPTRPTWTMRKEKPIELGIVDKCTFKFTFPEPYPLVLYNHTITWLPIQPKHYLKNFHPWYNNEATYEDLDKAMYYLNPDKPILGPWKIEKYDPAEGCFMVRNPYFWIVDTEGNQRPYIDRFETPNLPDAQAALLKVLEGGIEFGIRNLQSMPDLPLIIENEERGNYKVLFWQDAWFPQGNLIIFNYDLEDPKYVKLRKLLRDKRFRNAISISIDRIDVREALFHGLGQPASVGLYSASAFFDEEMAENIKINSEYDPERAKQILDELNLIDRDGDGIREYPDGKSVTIILDVASEISMHQNTGEYIVKYWQDIGLDARLNTISRSLIESKIGSKTYHAHIWGTEGAVIPMFRWVEGVWAPLYAREPYVDDPPADLKQIQEIREEIIGTADLQKVHKLLKKLIWIRAENSLHICFLTDVPLIVIRSNRIGNVPEKAHTFLGVSYIKDWQFYFKE